jgi:hypothetical protein
MDLLSWFKRSNAKSKPTPSTARSASANPYAGAEVVPRKDHCCEAVRAIAGKRFLSKHVPLIPLRDCDQPDCGCTYRRFADRRTGVRRAIDLGAGVFPSESFRRSTDRRRADVPGRRATDYS